ncbi:tyrosine-type recombinase/integrase [Fodinicurvata fenggangensis]|uniref:tyrosine-type recombinase/integrase n=1 Tax=Fodinicurvata fenggangensis TaxID=1121830 RepID=UPI00047E37E3|nr:tyrosine-type recombinase/integrase [Fodinicurvata fenggangensis]
MAAEAQRAWNKGKVVGKKPPLTPDQVNLIRLILRQEKNWRDLALFNVALDTSFRGCDLVRLKVSDVATPAGIRELVEIRQKKTAKRNPRPVQARLSEATRDSLRVYLAETEKSAHAWLFTGEGARWAHSHLSESQLWRRFKGWVEKAHLDPALYGLHSLRRTFPTYIHQQTGNLRAAQLLLGHASIESTKDYIGTEQAEALEIARKYHL